MNDIDCGARRMKVKNVNVKILTRTLIWMLVSIAVVGLAAGVDFLAATSGALSSESPPSNAQGHVSRVTPYISGHVRRVLVDDKSRVRQGDLLVELDREPYELLVSIRQAVVAQTEAEVADARAQVCGIIAQARSNRYKLQQAVEHVHFQIANLRVNVGSLNDKLATLELARTSLKRAEELAPSGVITNVELSKRQRTVQVEEAGVMQALQVVNSIRAEMGLSAEVASSPSISEAPTELAENEASVRQALSEFLHSLALLGYTPPSWKATPKQVIDDFHKQDSTGDLDTIYEQMIDRAPSVKQAEAKQLRARRELHLAELNLRYCRIVSAADGVVVRRIVNPGEQVELGQVLMEVRPLTASD